MAVTLEKGSLRVTGTPLWLDARRKSPLSFVSHAHSDHIARHERVIATKETLRLLTHRLGAHRGALSVPYGRPFQLGPLWIELLPAGHVLGSAQIRVTREDGMRIAYTGDFSLAPSFTAEKAEVAECDILVMESTFGHPRYVFAPKEQTLAEIERWVRDQLDRGVAPILLAYPLGKGQEVIHFLTGRGFDVCAHASIEAISQLYLELDMPVGRVRRFEGGRLKEGEVGIFPPHARRAGALRGVWPRATAVLTGWALDPGAAARYGADVAFPLSDHADFPALVSYAKATGASEIITLHGFAAELARALRGQGLQARALGQPYQMDLFPNVGLTAPDCGTGRSRRALSPSPRRERSRPGRAT